MLEAVLGGNLHYRQCRVDTEQRLCIRYVQAILNLERPRAKYGPSDVERFADCGAPTRYGLGASSHYNDSIW